MARKTNAQLVTAFTATDKPTQDGAWAVFWDNFQNLLDSTVRPYKVYTALLTQSGTSAPTATVLENTLGVTLTWSYSGVGEYLATSTGFFADPNKIAIFIQPAFQGGASQTKFLFGSGDWGDTDSIFITTINANTLAAANGGLTVTAVEIRYYD